MVAERKELTGLMKPPKGWFWSDEARERRRENLAVYNSRAHGGAAPWESSDAGPRADAEPTVHLPTLTPGVDKLPQACIFCRSRLLDMHEPAGGEQRGMLSCIGCGRQVCWLAPRIAIWRPEPKSAVTAPIPAASVVDLGQRMAAEAERVWRRVACGASCRRERVLVLGGSNVRHAAEWREYHDPDAHDQYQAALSVALVVALSVQPAKPDAIVRTGPLAMNLATRRCLVGGQEVGLSPTEWAILAHWARRLGALCTIDEVVAEIWPDGATSPWNGAEDGATHMFRVNLARLRGKLGEAAHLIENRPGFGYLLRAEPPSGVETDLTILSDPPPPARWARDWDQCRDCGRTDRGHYGRGYCSYCCQKRRRAGTLTEASA